MKVLKIIDIYTIMPYKIVGKCIYNKDTGKILSIPSLIYNTGAKKFTLKRCDKRQSTLKSLAPKKNKHKKNDKIDINN